MRIAVVTPTYPPYASGIGNVAAALASEAASHGHGVTVYTPRYASVSNETSAIPVQRLAPALQNGNAAWLPGISRRLAGADIIHLHYPFFGAAEPIWLGWHKLRRRSKLVLHYHMDVVGTGWRRPVFAAHTKLFLPRILAIANRVLVTSTDYAQHSAVAGVLQKRPEKFTELPNGVDCAVFAPTEKSTKLLEQHQIPNDAKVVLFVGGLDRAHYFKGVEFLLEAMSRLGQVAYGWRLLIVGDGDLRPSYLDLAGQLGISEQVVFAGRVSNTDLPAYYNLADAAVLPSVDASEAFGMVLVEAMACGKPVIASDLPGVRTVVDHEGNGRLVQPRNVDQLASAIHSIIANSEVAAAYGRAGFRKARQRYDWKAIGQQLDQVYRNL